MEDIKKPSELSIQRAAQAWCTAETSSIEMDTKLAFAFAEILDEVWSKPWLGNATTLEMLDELDARDLNAKEETTILREIMDLDYKTVEYVCCMETRRMKSDRLMADAKKRSSEIIRALTPIIDQMSITHLRLESLECSNFVKNPEEGIKEIMLLQDYLVDHIHKVLGYER